MSFDFWSFDTSPSIDTRNYILENETELCAYWISNICECKDVKKFLTS
jgi:hypothetical protein